MVSLRRRGALQEKREIPTITGDGKMLSQRLNISRAFPIIFHPKFGEAGIVLRCQLARRKRI
jgi:hypothetical protein